MKHLIALIVTACVAIASASNYTVGMSGGGPQSAGFLPLTRRIVLIGPGITLEQDLTFTSTSAIATSPTVVQLAWSLPAGTTTIAIPVTYSSSLDVSGARPYASLRANSAMGLAAQTVTAPSGGGSQTITFTFSATSAVGIATIDLVYPNTSLQGTVTWTPSVLSGQAATLAPGTSSNGGGPITAKGGGAHIIGG